MRVGRFQRGAQAVFVASGDGTTWHALPDIGIDAPDTQSVIERMPEVRRALTEPRAEAVDVGRGLICPLVRPSKVLGIGLNYRDHIRETEAEPPTSPMVFAKFPNALTGPCGDIVIAPHVSESVDYESELAVVIGKRARDVAASDALDSIFGYCVANDVSARDIQKTEPQFSRSKSFDTFCPIGPWITTADEINDPQDLQVSSWVNGDVRQRSTTAEMLFSVAELIAFLSQSLTLEPGDTILTGTPHGVGFAMTPPCFLRPGDVVRCEIEGLGYIENRVVRADLANARHANH